MIIGTWANEGITHDEEGAVVVLIGHNARERLNCVCLLHEDHLFVLDVYIISNGKSEYS